MLFIIGCLMCFCVLNTKFMKNPIEVFYLNKNRTKNIKQNIFTKSSMGMVVYWLIIYISLGFLTLCILFVHYSNNENLISILQKIIEKTATINDVMTTVIISIMSMAVVVVAFDKKYYLVCSIRNILSVYHFFESIVVTLVSWLFINILSVLLWYFELETLIGDVFITLYILIVPMNMVLVMYDFYIMIIIMFSNKNKELKGLLWLDQVFKVKQVDCSSFKKKEDWSKGEIEFNLEYLISNYIRRSRKIRIEGLKQLEFITTIGIYQKKWKKFAKKRVIIIAIMGMIIDLFYTFALMRSEFWKLLIFNGVFFSCIVGLVYILKNKKIRQNFNILFLDSWGYYFKDRKEQFIERFPWYPSKYYKFIISLDSLIGFFYIMLLIKVKKKKIEKAISFLMKSLDECEVKNIIFYLPVFIIGYFVYEKKNIQLEVIKEKYQSFHLLYEQKEIFFTMLCSYIFNLTVYKRKSKDISLGEKAEQYLQWLAE